MEPSGDPSEPSDGGSIVLFLGLYLLLVAFFIMLNAISHFDDGRVKEAVASVSETFQSPRPSSASQVRIALDGKTRIVPTTLFGNLQAEFRKALPVVEIEEDSEGGVLTVTLAARALFAPGRVHLDPAQAALVDTVAGVLKDGPARRHRVLELTVGDGVAARLPGAQLPLGVNRAGALARSLVERGVRPASILAGVRAGFADKIVMRFATERADAPRVTFEKILF